MAAETFQILTANNPEPRQHLLHPSLFVSESLIDINPER
jgi:hypothetical protein